MVEEFIVYVYCYIFWYPEVFLKENLQVIFELYLASKKLRKQKTYFRNSCHIIYLLDSYKMNARYSSLYSKASIINCDSFRKEVNWFILILITQLLPSFFFGQWDVSIETCDPIQIVIHYIILWNVNVHVLFWDVTWV